MRQEIDRSLCRITGGLFFTGAALIKWAVLGGQPEIVYFCATGVIVMCLAELVRHNLTKAKRTYNG